MKKTHLKHLELSDSFKVMGNPVRMLILLEILESACECDMESKELKGNCVTKIAEKLELPQPTVSNHVKELLMSGLIFAEKRGTMSYLFGSPEIAKQLEQFGQFFIKEVNSLKH